MAIPRVFISSTYSDLGELRRGVAAFIEAYGYQPVSFEKNDIAYVPTQRLEASCYDEVRECQMFVLLIKNRFGEKAHDTDGLPGGASVTQIEYMTARKIGIPIFVFVHHDSMEEYKQYKTQGCPSTFKFRFLDCKEHAEFVQSLFEDQALRFINTFRDLEGVKEILRKQWAGLFHKYLQSIQASKARGADSIPINPFKLFYFRRSKGISQARLAKASGLKSSRIQRLEDAGAKKERVEVNNFSRLPLSDAQRIAVALNCSVSNIRGGIPDDFLSQYLLHYFKNKGTSHRRKANRQSGPLFKTRAVVFDFDGTLTKRPSGIEVTTWERIWKVLGYGDNECADLHRRYSISDITHRQ